MSTEESQQQNNKASAEAAVSHNMTRQGGIVASMTMLSRISGLIRDVVLSYLFGASQLADMFFVAFRIPNFFRRLFAEGAFNQAFVPVLVRIRTQGRAEMLTFIAPLSGLFGLCLVFFVVLGVWLAPALTLVFAPGFVDNEQVFSQTVDLVRITFPYLGFISLTAYAGALLNAHNHFALPAFTPVLLNLTLICAALVALGGMSDSSNVTVVAWGVLVAGIVQFLFQLPTLARLGLLPWPKLDRKHKGVQQVGRLLVPAVLAASAGQINALVNTMLASTLITGSISWLYYADRLLELPVGLVAVALGTVMLPHLSRMAADQDVEQFRRTLDWGVNLGLMLGLPAAVALYLLAEPLIAALFMSFSGGAMTPYDVRMASYALEMFAVALPGFVLVKILVPAFFAHQDTKSPLKYAAGAVAANLIGSLLTFSWFGHVGLAWATAVSAWTHVILLYIGLNRRGLYRATMSLWPMLWKTLLASTILGISIIVVTADMQWMTLLPMVRVTWMVALAGAGVLLYGSILWVFGVRLRHLNHSSVG
jgi:putative peptidoglycan lipid II flippase